MPWIKALQSFIFAIIILLILWLFFRNFERSNIYFPMKKIEATPQDVGLSYEDVYLRAEDGTKLYGWFIPSKGAPPHLFPLPSGERMKGEGTLLFCHGNAGNISHRLDSIMIFHRLGLNVFIFDYRGYGKSSGRPSEEGTYQDAMAAYKYLILERGIKKESIILFGRSLGGAIAIDLATKVPAGALISESCFTSTVNIGKEIFPFLPVEWIVKFRYEALEKIKRVKVPVLIIHSKEDKIMPFHHGEELFQAAQEPKEFYTLRGGHNDGFFLAGKEYPDRIQSFLEKHLPR